MDLLLPGEPFENGVTVIVNMGGEAAFPHIKNGTSGSIQRHEVTENDDYVYLVEFSGGHTVLYFGDEFEIADND